MNQNDFDAELIRRIVGGIQIHEALLSKKLDSFVESISITFEILPVQEKDGEVLIPIGNRENPTGISLLKNEDIIVIIKGEDIIGMTWAGRVKKYIKRNINDLEKSFSTDLDAMAIKIKVKNILL